MTDYPPIDTEWFKLASELQKKLIKVDRAMNKIAVLAARWKAINADETQLLRRIEEIASNSLKENQQ